MAMLGKFLIFVAALGLLFAWATNYKTPEGLEQPWNLEIFFASLALFSRIDIVVNYFGYEGFLQKTFAQESVVPDSITRTEKYLAGVRTVIYRPADAAGDLPAIVFYHGGGWIFGSPESMQDFNLDLTKDLGIALISVDYRLAPKHPYPAPFEDCYKVTDYVVNNAEELKIDPKRISIGGDSAGGNLAAAVALKFRDEGKSDKLKSQLLLYPVVQAYDFQMPSMKVNEDDGILKPYVMASCWVKYALGEVNEAVTQDMLDYTHVPEAIRKEFIEINGNSPLLTKTVTKPTKIQTWKKMERLLKDPYFTPMVERNLTDLAPALVITVEQDILKNEGTIYAQRLKESGVKVVRSHHKDAMHGIYSLKGIVPLDYQRLYVRLVADIKKLL